MLVSRNRNIENNYWINFWWSGTANGAIVENTRLNNEFIFKSKENLTISEIAGNGFDLDYKQFGMTQITNIGTTNLVLRGLNIKESQIIKPNEKQTFYFTKKNRSFWLSLEKLEDAKKESGLAINRLMISDSPITVYLPEYTNLNKNLQKLYPPEGEYKEIQAR